MKRKGYEIEMTNWFGECEIVEYSSKRVRFWENRKEAEAVAQALRLESKATDDPEDEIRFRVVPVEFGPQPSMTL